jgi:cytochrome b6-f complex iron-sulfur subunit
MSSGSKALGERRSGPSVRRRGLLRIVFGTGAGVGLAALAGACGAWLAAGVRFLMPNATVERAERFRIGVPADYPPDSVDTRFSQSHGIWVVHGEYRGRQQIFALSTVCTHLGCITLWQSDQAKFKCPCHGSGFHVDGTNFEGPAPRPLPRYAIRIAEDGQLEVDRSRVFREELGQWSDPDSYVAG